MIYDKIDRCVVLGCAGCAMAHPDFVKSVKGDNLCLPNYYWHTWIFRPSDGPVCPFTGPKMFYAS